MSKQEKERLLNLYNLYITQLKNGVKNGTNKEYINYMFKLCIKAETINDLLMNELQINDYLNNQQEINKLKEQEQEYIFNFINDLYNTKNIKSWKAIFNYLMDSNFN